ncbi:MAG: mechanosensitive ion channel family protein [Abitibacteriaceae bacterium]|nr:mechanosensitive ion channel family protein [Abditibacteriaceae bacterium]MBV9864250.1 mechanosensitive ion channel family protein [Abditibacteriaceae bacterium]
MDTQIMDLRTVLAHNFTLSNLLMVGVRVVFIALIFEFIAWWAGRRIEKMTSPLITADANREANWRMRRRATLRQTPKIITRTLCYVAAIIAVLSIFESALPLLAVPVLPIAIVVGALCMVFGLAFLPLLRDFMQGYALLAEDTLAVGDAVNINGHQGVIEKMTLRGAWLRDSSGYIHCLSNRDIANIVVHQRHGETPNRNEPLDGPMPNSTARPPLNKAKR